MSTRDRSADPRGCGADVAAYALGALEPAEAEAFRAHLKTCAACREELAAFTAVVDVLPMAATQHRAPRRLRRKVMAAVEHDARARGDQPRRRRRSALGQRVSRPVLAVGALVVAAVIAVGAIVIGNSGSSTRVFEAKVIGERGSAKVAVTDGRAHLIVRDFSPPPAGKVYEVWLSRSGQKPTPTGVLFTVTPSGDNNVDVGKVHGADAVLVTPEPKGGSPGPTHTPVIDAPLS
jgi:anti-sigma factor RsiW